MRERTPFSDYIESVPLTDWEINPGSDCMCSGCSSMAWWSGGSLMCYMHTCMFVLHLKKNTKLNGTLRLVSQNGKLIPFVLPCINRHSKFIELAFDTMMWIYLRRN